jgi:cytochrome P450
MNTPPTLSTAQLDLDPHGVFRRYRLITPFLRREDDSYIAIRWRDVECLATDPRTRQMETERLIARGINSGALFDIVANTMLYSNGAAHRRRRAPLSRAFAFRLIAGLRPRVRAVANLLINRVGRRGEMSLLDDYAALIPAYMISDLLGLPESDIPDFARWVYSISRALSFSFTPQEFPEVEDAARQLTAYVAGLIATRRSSPREDFLSAFATDLERENNLSPSETLSQIITIFIAGSDTARGAIAVQAALLLQHKEQWEAALHDASLVPGAVLEALRFEPSVGSTPSFTLDDIQVGGYVVPAGRVLSLSTLSAMRDPALYFEPDSFNIRRSDHPRRHLVFGGGPHRCLGEMLARAELEEALAALLEHFPTLTLMGDPPKVFGHAGIRRVSAIRVGWSRRAWSG